MKIYYADSSFSQFTTNPYQNDLPYSEDWIVLKLLEKKDGKNLLKYDYQNEVARLMLTKEDKEWAYRAFDFIQYQSSHHKNIIVAVDEHDLATAKSIYGNSCYMDKFLRPYEKKVLIHSTTKESYHAIMQDRCLKSWNTLNKSDIIENTPIGQLLGDTADNSDYIMFTSGGLGAERVVSSKQKGKINFSHDVPYLAGARFYFDAEKIAKEGLLVRDGRQIKVKDSLPIDEYLLWIATPSVIDLQEETTPRIFAEKANAMFTQKFNIPV